MKVREPSVAYLPPVDAVQVFNMHEAKTNFSRLVEQAEAGKEIIIARHGKPVARLMSLRTGGGIKLGVADGQIEIPDDFDAPMPPGIFSFLSDDE